MGKRELVQEYLDRGWVPFSYAGQFTPGNEWQKSTVGPNTLDQIMRSDTPVGLLLGEVSKSVVVDIDPRNGGDLNSFITHYQIPKTRIHATAGGGWHVFFTYAGYLQKTKGEKTGVDALKGVDLLAHGSNVLAPPSVRVNHPEGKPDGSYSVMVDGDPIELPDALRDDWEAATAKSVPVDSGSHELISEENYALALANHKMNVDIAARAPEGSRDDTCIQRIGASMRVCLGVPDDVLSIEKLIIDFEEACPYEIKDMEGKITRAIEWASERIWVEPVKPHNATLPDSVPPEMAAEYWEALAKLRVREAAKETFTMERVEAEARKVKFGDYVAGEDFIAKRPDTPRWLVEGLIHHGGSTLLAAQYKAGKSTLMLNLVKSMTTGTQFLGQFAVPNELKVAFVDMELGYAMSWDWFNDIPGVNYRNMIYFGRVGLGAQLNFMSETIRSKWARVLRTHGVDVLIVDPLSPVMSALGIDENHAETVRPLLDSFDQLKVEANLQGVVVTHHTGHQNAGRARGSTAFNDWPTSILSITKQGEDEQSERAFRAFGRDVSVSTTTLMFDQPTRTLALSSGLYRPDLPPIADDF